MNQSKVHSEGKIPFSWENKPGISNAPKKEDDAPYLGKKLPPPPCPSSSSHSLIHEIQIPLPPCPFPPPSRSDSRKGIKKLNHGEDPFLAAFKECTKGSRKSKLASGLKKALLDLSCKQSDDVIDDSFVRLPRNPNERE